MDKLFSRKVTFFSFIYSILIICFHADARVPFKNVIVNERFFDRILFLIDVALTESGGVYFFIILSAFLLYYNLTETNIKDKLLRRVKTLLIPWVIWNTIGTISYYKDWNKGIGHIVTCYLTSRYCEVLWFVQMLIIMLLFLPVIRRIFKIKYLGEVFLVILFLLDYLNWPLLQGLNIFPSDKFKREVFRMLTNVPMYCFGAYMGLNWSEIVLKESYNKIKGIKLVAIILLIVSIAYSNTFIGFVLRMLQSVLIWILVDKKIFNFHLQWWMQISFYTYAIHTFISHWEKRILKLSGLFTKEFESSTVSIGFALAWRLSLSAITFTLVVFSAYILIKYMPKFYETLSGGRVPKKDK